MADARKLIQDAIRGNPPNPLQLPSREGVIAAIEALADLVDDLEVSGDQITKRTWAQLSLISGTRANQRGTAETDTGTHVDPISGLTVPNQGVYSWVTTPVAGWTWVGKTAVPAGFDIDPLTNIISFPNYKIIPSDQDTYGVSLDKFGFVIEEAISMSPDGTENHLTYRLVPSDQNEFGLSVDKFGFVIDVAGGSSESVAVAGSSIIAFMTAQDAEAAGYSAAVARRIPPNMAGMYWTYTIVQEFGQSLAQGGSATQLKTQTLPDMGVEVKTVGPSSRLSSYSNTAQFFGATTLEKPDGAAFDVNGRVANSIGPYELYPARFTCIDIDASGGGRRWNPAVWVGDPANGSNGEASIVSFAYEVAKAANEWNHELTGQFRGRTLLAFTDGFGGTKLVDLLSASNLPGGQGFSPKLRTQSRFAQTKTFMVAGSFSYGIMICNLNHGQADANGTKADYYAQLEAWDAFSIDLAQNAAYCNQKDIPMRTIMQTSDHWVAGKSAVPQAQHEFCLANNHRGVYGVATCFSTPGKMEIPSDGVSLPGNSGAALNEHKDGNGSRWLAAYLREKWYKIRMLGRGYEHPHLVRGRWITGTKFAILSWHLEHPPIQFLHAFLGYRKVFHNQNGLNFYQNAAEIAVAEMTIFGQQSVKVVFDRVPTSGVAMTVDVGILEGRHNVADSSKSVAKFNYVHSHQDYAARNPDPGLMTAQEIAINNEVIAELGYLFGKPYPLQNRAWSETFVMEEIAV